MKRMATLALTAAICCTSCSHAGATRASRSQLVFTGLAGEPDSLNPMLSNEADELNFSHLYMSYLIENDDKGNEVPEIAAAVPTPANGGVSSDQRTITYRLRRNVRWQPPKTKRSAISHQRSADDVPHFPRESPADS